MEKSKEKVSCIGCKNVRWINSNGEKVLWCDTVDRKVNASYFADNAPNDCPRKKETNLDCSKCEYVHLGVENRVYCKHPNKKYNTVYVNNFYKEHTAPEICPLKGEEKEKDMESTKLKRVSGFKDVGCVCRVETVNDAWEYWHERLTKQAENDKRQMSRDGEVVGEVINAITIVNDPTRFIVTSPIRKMPMRYAVGELLWYLSGNPTLDAIRPFTNAWDRMSDDGKTVNSNYGEKIYSGFCFNQWEYVKSCLKNDKLSRQAVINIREPKDYDAHPTKDMPCTLTLQFLARPDVDGDIRLHLTTNMRSNDIWMGFPYDCFNFCAFLNKMAMELGFKVGTYTHIAGSLHLYRRDYEKGLVNENGDEDEKTGAKTIG